MASILKLHRDRAVSFIDWLDAGRTTREARPWCHSRFYNYIFVIFVSSNTFTSLQQTRKRAAAYPHERQKGQVSFGGKTKEEQSEAQAQRHPTSGRKGKLAALTRLEKRSVSNLIEVMADEMWDRLAEREGIDWAKTVAEIAGLNGLNADKDADRKAFRREMLERVLKFKKR